MFESLTLSHDLFLLCALLGSGITIIQFILNLVGLTDSEGFIDGETGNEVNFKYLSIQTFSGFLMMFGWTALACQNEFNFDIWLSLTLSILAGFFAVFMLRMIFKIAKGLQSTGSKCHIEDVIGKEAFVYQRIPKNGVGKISVSFQHLTYELDAISNNEEEIPSFTSVQIVKKRDNTTVVVMPLIKK